VGLLRIALQQEGEGVGQVLHVEELSARLPRTPDREGLCAGRLGFVRLVQQGRDHVTRGRIEVVAWPVEVRRHGRDEVAAVLTPVGLAQFQAGNLGNGVPLIGRLQRAGQEGVFRHRLGRVARIDAGRAEKQQLLDPAAPGAMDDVGLDRQIVVDELGRPAVVRLDAADRRGRHDDRLGPHVGQPGLDVALAPEIDLRPAHREDLAVFVRQPPDQRGADHAAVAGHPDPAPGEPVGGVSHGGFAARFRA
jgi:hypothetical protein